MGRKLSAEGHYCIFCNQIIYKSNESGYSRCKNGTIKAWHTECWEKSFSKRGLKRDHTLKVY